MPAERLPDGWYNRDFLVLIEAARAIDAGDPPNHDDIAETVGLDTTQVQRTMSALRDAEYLAEIPNGPVRQGMAAWGYWTTLTEKGRRAVGIWPSGTDVDALIDALRQAEQSTADPVEQGRIRQAAGALMSVSRDVMVDVIAAVVAKQTGIG